MQILKFFLSVETIEPPYNADIKQDPLNHPDLARMSPTALADLPLGPEPRTPPSGHSLQGALKSEKSASLCALQFERAQ
ncbi:hypothetical protein [Rhizobium sp. 3T7]|uniref:hypothetical protein n=1 Tax=Rhizobium sp. 3T7 TaxID=2874922 RepID=UPI00398D18F0